MAGSSPANVGSSMLASSRKNPDRLAAVDRVRDWVRGQFKLTEDTAVLVAEVACTVPGCPPLETVIAFWSEERRHHFKVFKPVMEVERGDLPPSWMKGALAVPDDFECACC